MRIRRNAKLLVEPPSVATGDIAFNLIVFFLVCASSSPDSGRKQNIPKSESKPEKAQQSENIEISMTRTAVSINGKPTPIGDFESQMRRMMSTRKRQEDRVVVVRSTDDTPYDHWILVTGLVEQAGGIVTLQLEEQKLVLQ